LALGFAFQDIAANFMSGFIMALYRPFEVNDLVEVADKKCRVVRVELRATEVETLDGLSILVPNKAIFQNPIINYTRTRFRRMDLSMGASYGDDMEKVRSTVLAAVRDVPKRDPEREPELFFDSFGDSSINFQLRIWLLESTQPVYMAARSEAMIAIKKAFDREGITIPFPIRTLDFGAGGVGGERLDAMKLEWGGSRAKEPS
jgi:small conductance mechanosensitive channel